MKVLMMAFMLMVAGIAGIDTASAQEKKTTDVQTIVKNLEQTVVADSSITVGNDKVDFSALAADHFVPVQSVLDAGSVDQLKAALEANAVAKATADKLASVFTEKGLLNNNQKIVGVLSGAGKVQFVVHTDGQQ
ncbi:MAG: hypothetical protein ACXWV4_11295 [Flavitalea sp.]